LEKIKFHFNPLEKLHTKRGKIEDQKRLKQKRENKRSGRARITPLLLYIKVEIY
jgi:hypothetical protein